MKPAELREYFSRMGRKGGKARASRQTPEQRKAQARKAIQARWAKAKEKEKKEKG